MSEKDPGPAADSWQGVVYVPGDLVRHPGRPDWGLGQVQSVIADRITVNFQHGGKVVLNAGRVELHFAGTTGG